MAINFAINGSLVSSDFNINNVFPIYLAEYKESEWLPYSRWNSSSEEYIKIKNDGTPIQFSDVATGNRYTNLITNPRINIVHRGTENYNEYVYDGCYYTWLYNEFGGQYNTLKLYARNNLLYQLDFSIIQNLGFTTDVVSSIYLVVNVGEEGEIGGIRPIVGIGNQYFIICPLIPQSVITEWSLKRDDTDKPNGGEPYTKAPVNEYSAEDWENTFDIMRGIPAGIARQTGLHLLRNYTSTNDVLQNWDDLLFYLDNLEDAEGYLGTGTGALEYNTAVETAIVSSPDSIGSSLHAYQNLSPKRKFVTGVRRLDGSVTYSNLPSSHNDIVINRNDNTLKIEWTNDDVTDVLSRLKISTIVDGENFSYTYGGNMGKIDTGGGEYYSLGVWCTNAWIYCIPESDQIPPNVSGFYLLGWINVEQPGNRVKGNLVAIDKLDGLKLDKILDAFDSEKVVPEDFTEKLVEEELGGDLGTGELIEVESIDSENTHDGTMGNGTGSVHEGDTTIPDPELDLPVAGGEGSVLGSGFIKVYTPTKTQLDSFTSELLSDNVIDVLKDYFTTNPMEGIIGMSMLPYTGFSSNTTGKAKIGTYKFNTELDTAGKEYLTVDYGTIDVKFSYDGYENYSQYSDCKIFLPHIGYKEIDIDMVQGCRLHLKYLVSLVTGDIYAYLYAKWVSGKDKGANNLDHLLYHWQGNCNMTVPVTHVDKSSYVNGAIQAAGNIASIVSGGVTMNALAGQMTMAGSSGEYAALNKQFEGAGLSVGRNISGLGSNVASMFKPSITTSGNISGACAYMSERTPYLLLSRPIITGTEDIKRHYGLVTCKKYKISELKNTGYTELNGVDLNGVSATEEELNELKSILEGGYYA